MKIVIDTSVTLAWCLKDERTPLSIALLNRVAVSGAVVPNLWHYEVANAMRVAEIRGRIDATDVDAQLENLRQLGIETDDTGADAAWMAGLSLARAHRLTIYDAAYVELARRRSFPIASRDKEIIAAAGALGLMVVEA